MKKKRLNLLLVVCVLSILIGEAQAQSVVSDALPLRSSIVVPQARPSRAPGRTAIEVTGVEVGIVILEQAATTTMDITVSNPSRRNEEVELAVPVPDGAVVRSFAFHGAAKEPTAVLLPKPEANKVYESIVAKLRDPALLEFLDYNLVRSSVFPVPAGGTQKVRLTYEHLLPAEGNRIDYILPRTESLDYTIPWRISVRIKSKRPIATVYSPSHRLQTQRVSQGILSARIADDAATDPGPFRLSYLLEGNGVTASLFAYPDPGVGGGYFLLLAGLPAVPPEASAGPAIKRELTLVIDRSGSMSGEKIQQVRESALQVLAGLEEGESFNLIAYNEAIEAFSAHAVLKTPESVQQAHAYLKSINARGGTNIHDALVEALRQKPSEGVLPIVLFMTDGLPTVGQTSEVAIREVAIKANPYERRIFTFGVGVDVNTPLLDKIASETRATATYVLPKEDVEVKVSQVFNRLAGPVLAGPTLQVGSETERLVVSESQPRSSASEFSRAHDVIPSKIPDLFAGDQLVVLGQYMGDEPLNFHLRGNYLGKQRTFRFTFDLDRATTRNAFVPRLWASRKIGVLVDAVRQLGADRGSLPGQATLSPDRQVKELVDEIVSLSTQFGILTEYTAFLAREGTDLTNRDEILAEANRNFLGRAMAVRTGLGSVNQSSNNDFQMNQDVLNFRNNYFDQNMNRVAVSTVQQINDRAFYRRGGRWVDSRINENESAAQSVTRIEFGSREFRELALRLARQGRQGSISLSGDVLMIVDGEAVLVASPTEP
jgi:Ca-activated chloride channel family protein